MPNISKCLEQTGEKFRVIFQTGLLTSLDFTWDGVTYNAATANDAFMAVDNTGALSTIMFGDNCTSLGCNVTGPGQWLVVLNISGFAYQPSVGVEGFGTATYAQAPEPASFILLGLGGGCLATIGRMKRRRGSPTREPVIVG